MTSHRRRQGVTLLELMITLPSATILIGAMAGCIAIMMRARSQDDTTFRSTYDLSNASARIAADIESATAIVSSSATHIEMVVPDRNADGLPEQMRYEWGGNLGANANKLMWKYNQGALETLFDDIGSFDLQRNTVAAPLPTLIANQFLPETAVLKSINALPSASFREQVVNASNSVGQYFIPDVPGTGIKWDLGSIRIMVRAADANVDGVLCVRVMRSSTTNQLPVPPILAEVKISESRLGANYQWLDIPLAPISGQAQGVPLCITLNYGGGTGDVAKVQFLENGVGMPSNANLVTSINGGTTWTASTGIQGLRFYAYGLYDGYNGQRTFLNSIDLKLSSSQAVTRKIETSIRLPASPEVP
jgi:hypothetical protein